MYRFICLLSCLAMSLPISARTPPRPAPSGPAPRVEWVRIYKVTDRGDQLTLSVPANIFGQLQVSSNAINLSQIGGASVSSSLYDSGNTALKVNCVVGCSATGAFTDNGAFTTGSTSVTNISGLFNDSPANLTSGNAGAVRATTDRMLFVNLGKISGTVPGLTGSSLNVNCTGGCGSPTTFADNSAFTAGTTSVTNIGGVFNDGLSAVTSGNAAAPRITNNRALHVNLRNNSGTEIGTSSTPVRTDPTGTTTQPVSGTITANIGTTNGLALDASVSGILNAQASATSGQKGPLDQCAVSTAAPSYTTAQTDPLSCTTGGALREDITTIAGTAPTTAGKLDVKGADGDVFVRRATAANLNVRADTSGATGSAVPARADFIAGRDSSASGGGLNAPVLCDKSAVVSVAASGDTQLVALAASQIIYVCGYNLFANGAVNVQLEYGTGSNCATGKTALTGAYNFTAQTGISYGNGAATVTRTASANALCINLSAAVQVSGIVTYAQF